MSKFNVEEYELLKEIYIEETLDEDKHLREVSDFECGNEPLNVFLKSEAFKYAKEGQGNTYIIKNNVNNDIIGYYTLKANAIQIQKYEKATETLPAIEIARLAIDNKYQNQKIGTWIFYLYILSKVIEAK